MRKLLFASLLLIMASCTKEVPETEKKTSKLSEEKNALESVENFVAAYNSNDIAKAVTFFTADYKGIVADSDEVLGLDALKDDLSQYRKQYPEGKWELKIDEVHVSGELAYIFTSGSFLMPDPVEGKMNPIYSERAIRILKKQKNDGWKIFRYMATQMFSYDQR